MRKLPWLLAIIPLLALAQNPAPTAPGATQPASELETATKIIGAIITGIATLIGLPLVFLTYRKTRAEIAKLELEARALREKQPTASAPTAESEGIRVIVDHSQNVTVQVLADPRFLAPLLLLVDFIFAWVLLTLAAYFLRIFDVPGRLALAILAAILLLPIVKQIFRVRAMLRPLQTQEEIQSSFRQMKRIAYAVYCALVLLCGGFATLFFTAANVTTVGHYLAWALVASVAALLLAGPLLRPRLIRYLAEISGAASLPQIPR